MLKCQPTVSAMNSHYEDLQPYVNLIGANETAKQNAALNAKWDSIKENVRLWAICIDCSAVKKRARSLMCTKPRLIF